MLIQQGANLVPNSRCKLIDVGETGQVVAEGTIASTDPTTMVHCVPLGKDAVKVWVNFVRVNDALLWRPTSECTYMEDAFGTTIAWPAAYVIGESSSSKYYFSVHHISTLSFSSVYSGIKKNKNLYHNI